MRELARPLEGEPPPPEKAAILIVDDQEGNLQVLEGLLAELGQDVVKATSGSQALSSLLERDFAVILLDVRMPIMDGFETAELIRRRRRSRQIPIIFITAVHDDVEHVARGYSLGAVDYITKPLNEHVLRSKVKVFIELYLQGRELALKTAELTAKNQILENEITKRMRIEQILEKSRDFYLALFDEFPTLVWRSDETGKISYFNRSWLAFVGRSLEEETRGGWDRGIHPEDREQCVRSYRAAFQARVPFEMEYRHLRQDGEYRWILNHGRPYQDQEGRFSGFIGSCYDITPRRKGEEEIRAVNAELEAFSYSVSHDLRAPLRSMVGFCQILIEDYASGKRIDGEWRDFVERISAAATRMDQLIRDLLAFSQMAREQVQLGPVEMGPLLSELVAEMRVKEDSVRIDGPSAHVVGNRLLLCQVFTNLISNGLKFVAPGSEPRVRVRSDEATSGWIRIWVEDNGIGIAPQYHDRIFQVFERLHSSSAYPGTGIGLAIVRRAIGRMGGRVGVESEEGLGSRFWVELPKADPDCPVASSVERSKESSGPE
jgi:PAS domain S-box-containing protein